MIDFTATHSPGVHYNAVSGSVCFFLDTPFPLAVCISAHSISACMCLIDSMYSSLPPTALYQLSLLPLLLHQIHLIVVTQILRLLTLHTSRLRLLHPHHVIHKMVFTLTCLPKIQPSSATKRLMAWIQLWPLVLPALTAAMRQRGMFACIQTLHVYKWQEWRFQR